MGIEITVMDDRGYSGWMASASRVGELYMTSTAQMVRAVVAHAGSRRIDRLNICDHGSPRSMEIGDDRINAANLSCYAPILEKLRGHFSNRGFVHLLHCCVGQNIPLISRFAKILGVPVYAGTGMENPVYRVNLGHYVRAEPNGQCTWPVPRP